MQRAIIVALASAFLSSCNSTGSGDALKVSQLATPKARPPSYLVRPCRGNVKIPHRELTEGETARLWGRDRTSNAACPRRHSALVDWLRHRDEGLAGQKLPEAPQEPIPVDPFAQYWGR